MAEWSIWWRIEPCGRIGAHRTTIRRLVDDSGRPGGQCPTRWQFSGHRDIFKRRAAVSSNQFISQSELHWPLLLFSQRPGFKLMQCEVLAQPKLGKNEAKKRMWQNSGGQTWTGLADIGSWSEGSSVVDFQEVLWSVGSFPTISVRAV